jgi:phenylacetate-coenzyme A ligase PaaK-like adenylate-forming protein
MAAAMATAAESRATAPLYDPWRQAQIGADVVAMTHASPARLAACQRERLRKLLSAARAGSVFYRQRLRGLDDDAELASLPPVTKAELMCHFDGWVADPALSLPALQAFVADASHIGEAFAGRVQVWESSGTSGRPGVFVHDVQAMTVYDALEALRRAPPRPLQRWLDPLGLGERYAFVGATGGHFASMVSVQRLRLLNPWLAGRLRSFSILQPRDDLVAELEAWAPTVLATYPTAAAMLADESEQGRLRIRPLEVWTGGETLGAATRARLQQVWGCAVRNSYGASEFLSIAWECEAGHLHVNADWVLLEPVDEHHRPLPPGVASCTTLLTNLANTVQPLIRYELGDQVTLLDGACPCGATLPRIDVRGRLDDPLVLRGDDGQTVTLPPLALTTVLEDEAHVFDFQLRQRDARTLVLRVGGPAGEAHDKLARCHAALRAYARGQGVTHLRLVDEPGRAVPLGRSGKAQRIVARASPVRRGA